MKLSAIGSYLTQTEAAILYVLAEKIMFEAEQSIMVKDGAEKEDACEAQEAAYVLKTVAEQSILANDGLLMEHVQRVKNSEVCGGGWIDSLEQAAEWYKNDMRPAEEQGKK